MTTPLPPSHDDIARARYLGCEDGPLIWHYSPCQPGCEACEVETGLALIYPELPREVDVEND